MTTLFYVDEAGHYLGGFAGVEPPPGAIEIAHPPADARQVYDAGTGLWSAPPQDFPILTPRQLWLAARQIGITKDQVLAIIDAMPETTPEEIDDKQVARIEIMEAPSYKRDHPLVAMLSGLVGLTATELDDLWVWAAGL